MKRKFRIGFLAVIFVCLQPLAWCVFPHAFAEEASNSGATEKDGSKSALTIENLEQKIKELDEKIRLAKLAENDETATQLGVTLTDVKERTTKLKITQSFYKQTLTVIKEATLQEKELSSVREKVDAQEQTGLLEKPPYGLGFYDRLQGQLGAWEQKAEAANLAVSLSEKSVKEAKAVLEKYERKWRSIRDAVQSGEDGKDVNWAKEMTRLDRDMAEASLLYLETNLENLRKETLIAQQQVKLYGQQIPWVRKYLQIDPNELEKALKELNARRSELEDRLQKLSAEEEQITTAWLNAREQLEASAKENERLDLEAAFKERDAWKETYKEALKQTESMLLLVSGSEEIVRNRHLLLGGKADREAVRSWRDVFEDRITKISRAVMVQQGFQASLQAEISSLERMLTEGGLNPQAMAHVKNRLKAMHKLAENRNIYMSALLEFEQQARRLLDDIGVELSESTFREKFVEVKKGFEHIWEFEIWIIDDNAVTVKKVVVAVFILVIGIFIVRFSVKYISRRLIDRAKLQITTVSAIQKTVSVFAYGILVLFVLRIVNIPLGIFTFLGGAIAIGVGFGAQNLINNFISGFIIMAERPISIGDLIEVGGVVGKVEEIGSRCTRVCTGENIRILVPNSSFLEKDITNWTLADRKIRAHVTVGVIYGSPTEDVKRLLLEAVEAVESVEKYPRAFVLFDDFGDNALIFSVHFWISVTQNMERRKIESAIRFRIDELFGDSGIVIAFPQRDVHIDSTRPLEFRMVKDRVGGEDKKESEFRSQKREQ